MPITLLDFALSFQISNVMEKFESQFEDLDVHTQVGTAKKKRPCYLVGNLVATNWPIEKALHAIGYNQIPTK